MLNVWRRARCPCARQAAGRREEKEPLALLSCKAQVAILLSGMVSCLIMIKVVEGMGGSSPVDWLSSEVPLQLLNPVLYMNDYRPEDYAISGSNLRRAMEISAGNVGNLIWMHGGWNLLQEPSAHEFIYSSLDDPRLPTFNTKGFYFPVANIFGNRSVFERRGAADKKVTVDRITNAIKLVKGPTLMLGAGSQGFYQPGLSDRYFDLEEGFIDRDISAYVLASPHLDLLEAIREKNGFVLARGNFTTAILQAHGFDRVLNAGCPSLFANPSPGLGAQLESKLTSVRGRLQQGKLVRTVINLPPFYRPNMLKLLLRILLEHGLNRLVIQDERDVETLATAEMELGLVVPAYQKAWFTSAAAWREYMCRHDFVLSGRIHGTMVGLACAVPGFIIAPDMRVLELAESMQLPHADPFQRWLHDIVAVKPSAALLTIVERTSVDFRADHFDSHRCKMFRLYHRVFNMLGFEIKRSLARLCEGFALEPG